MKEVREIFVYVALGLLSIMLSVAADSVVPTFVFIGANIAGAFIPNVTQQETVRHICGMCAIGLVAYTLARVSGLLT